MGRISALTELTSLANDDYLLVLDSSANIAKKITVANAFGLSDFGWNPTGETWTYTSWTLATKIGVVTVPSDATTKYSVGMKVKLTQSTGGTKYARITGVTSTTLSLFFLGSGTVFNNEAITSPQYSIANYPYAPSTINFDEQQPWINTSLTNGVITTTVSYYKDSLGVVRLRGQINLTGNLTMFTLPAGYRPEQYKEYSTSTGGTFGIIGVDTSGNVFRIVGTNGNVDLDLVSFRAA